MHLMSLKNCSPTVQNGAKEYSDIIEIPKIGTAFRYNGAPLHK